MKKILFLFVAGTANHAFAQSNIDLDPVSVTTTRIAQKSNETGRNITVLEGKLFQQLPVNSLDELLKYVPGVEVQSRGPMGAQSDIVLRGGTYQQVLVLIDGLKINDPTTGHFNSYIPVAPAEIERIEILRGPAAATYGAEAVGGVINVITKTFNRYSDSTAMHGHVKGTAGEYNFFGADAGIAITGKKANGSIGVLSNNTTGQLLRGNNRGYLNNHTVSGSLAFKLGHNWQLSLRSSLDSRDFAAQNFYTTFASDTATEKVTTIWNQVQLKQQGQKGSQQFDVVYKRSSDNYLYNEASVANENISGYALAQYINNHKFSNAISTSAGAQLSQRSINSNDRGDHTTAQAALFGTMLYSVQNWRLSGSLRSDWDENYGFAVLPQANISYVFPNITLRANAGRAIRSADFTERYNNYNKALVKSGSIGNPDLTAEKSWSYEAGATARLGNYFKLGATGFYRDQNDVIDWTTTPYANMPRQSNLDATGVYALAKNVKKVQTTGVEVELSFQKTLARHHNVYLNLGATFLDSKSNDSIPSFYIIAHAKTMVQGTLMYAYKKLNLSVNMLYKERKAQEAKGINATVSPSYFLLNARIGFNFNKHWSIFANCNNITDVTYSDLLGSKMPQRWFTGGAAFAF
ncbi:MAG TPA: TonB-dependent receptor [Chitinophagaceae bacterium]|nr:TonB-dependent receptor [Chitinophagaceae bacterium]